MEGAPGAVTRRGCGMPGVSKMTTWVGKFESIFQW